MKTPPGPVGIGIVGYGQVGAIFCDAMRRRGARVSAYDVVASKVESDGVAYLPLKELVLQADYILCTVTSREAVNAAEACRAFLSEGKTYVDLNSTSPSLKRRLEEIVRPSGAIFAEGAILGAVGVTGAKTRILMGGPGGRAAAAFLSEAGLAASFYHEETGKASTFKMLRGVFSKGMEALLLEFLVAARRAGIEADLWADVSQFMSENDFQKVASNWVCSHAVAHDRRHDEMVQVLEVLRELGVPAPMTEATEGFFAQSGEMDWAGEFRGEPGEMMDVVEFMERSLSGRL